MNRILLAAGIGFAILTVTMSSESSNNYAALQQHLIRDTVPGDTSKPKKDTTKPDTSRLAMYYVQCR